MPESKQQDFFVGYLPTPRSYRRFLALMAATIAVTAVVVALVVARGQRDPGAATWDLDRITSFEGVIYSRPCPLLRVVGPDKKLVSILLVEEGKAGAGDRIANLDGQYGRVSGHTLTRAKLTMLELDARAIQPLPSSPATWPKVLASLDGAETTLRGEIIDPKCFAGAMKPGDGKTHKSCAALCLRGGIPPVFWANQTPYLLLDDDGKSPSGAILEELIAHVGEPVEIRGRAGTLGDLRVLKLSTASIRRL